MAQEIKDLPQSKSNEGDAALIREQMSLYRNCLDIDEHFFLSKPEVGMLSCKYFSPELRMMTDQFISQAAITSNDPQGLKNYIYAFLEVAEINLKRIEEIIACQFAAGLKNTPR